MINKKEFDLLLQEIFQIENKIVEVKVLNQFDKASEYEIALERIRLRAKDIVLDNENNSKGFDDISLQMLSDLIILDSEVDYYLLKASNIIESSMESLIDAEAIKKIKQLWDSLEKDIEIWNDSTHNPIEEIEFNKHIGKITLEIIIYQLQAEGILDFSKVLKYCKREYLVNAIKEILFEGAQDEFHDQIRRRKLINLAKNVSEKDLYDYKIWKQVLMIKNVRERFDHIEIVGNIQEKDNNKYFIEEKKLKKETLEKNKQGLDIYDNEDFWILIKKWFTNLTESTNQKKMEFTWSTAKGPAFKSEFQDGSVKYSKDNLDKNTIESVKKLTIATDGIAKYNFEKCAKWNNLEEIEFLQDKNSSSVDLNPDKTYNCIGNESFANATKLKNIEFGKIEMIGKKAFENCISLVSIVFSDKLMNIGEDAFLNCRNLTKVEFLGELELYILDRPQNVINCFKGTNLEEIVFSNLESVFNFAITDCPNLKKILVSKISNISIPFKTCKYRIGRQEGIVSFVGEKSLNLWKKRNSTVRFFELTDEDRKKFLIKN